MSTAKHESAGTIADYAEPTRHRHEKTIVRHIAVTAAEQPTGNAAGDNRADLEDRPRRNQHRDQSNGRDRGAHAVAASLRADFQGKLCVEVKRLLVGAD